LGKIVATFAFEINDKIREKKNILNDLIKRGYSFNKAISLESIFAHLKYKADRHSFYHFMQLYIDKPPGKPEEDSDLFLSTIRIYPFSNNKFRRFEIFNCHIYYANMLTFHIGMTITNGEKKSVLLLRVY
jgi:hypothetical protein